MMFKLIIFDLDGTLVDAFDDIAAAANDALARMDRPALPHSVIRAGVGHGVRNLMAHCLGEDARDTATLDRAARYFVDFYMDHNAEQARPYPGAVDAVRAVRDAGIKTAVLSNKLHDLTVGALERLGMIDLFDDVLGESARFPRKPAPDALRHLMEGYGASPASTAMVGDGPADIAVARNAGCRFIGVTTGLMTRPQFEAENIPSRDIIDSMSELTDLLSI